MQLNLSSVGIGSYIKDTDLHIDFKIENSPIKSKEYLGEYPVYSITVEDKQHRYWSGGCLVGNCSEYMSLDNTSCNLASYNVKNFIKNGSIDYEKLEKVVSLVITAMDIIVDNAYYPIDSVEKNTKKYRSLGLGYSNLGATLMSLGIPYDSDKSREFASLLTALTTGIAFKTSQKLAEKVGNGKWWSGTTKKSMYKVLHNHYNSLLDVNTMNYNEMKDKAITLWKNLIKEEIPIRNTQVSLLAPTGTISFLMGCDTFGIEPDFSLIKYKRLSGQDGSTIKTVNNSIKDALKVLKYTDNESESIIKEIIEGKAIEKIQLLKPEHYSVFDTAVAFNNGKRSIHYKGHLKMMSAVQPFLSGAISKTVNIPNESTEEDIYNIYLKAWEMGLKSVALYRDGSKNQQVLYTKKERNVIKGDNRKKLPDDRKGTTHKFTINGDVKGYITANTYDDGNLGEVFVNIAKTGSTLNGLLDSLFTLTSISLQYGVPLEVLSKKLIGSKFEPAGFTRNGDIRTTTSLVDYIFRYLAINYLQDEKLMELGLKNKERKQKNTIDTDISTNLCPECGSLLKKLGSCEFCDQCAWNGGACS
jgi:ribonucleoside-diphosphate reductase alpha chain